MNRTVQGKLAESRPLVERALTIEEGALGPDHPDVAYTLNTLGVICDEQVS